MQWSQVNECHMGGKGITQSKGYILISSTNGLLLLSTVLEICKLQTVIFDENSVECVLGDNGVAHSSSLLGWVQMQQWDEVVCWPPLISHVITMGRPQDVTRCVGLRGPVLDGLFFSPASFCTPLLCQDAHLSQAPSRCLQQHWTTTQPKTSHFSSFLTVQLLFKCRFVDWRRGLPRKFAYCVSMS